VTIQFNHNPLPKLSLKRIDSPEGRRYITPEGNSYPSVTTVLSKLSDFSAWEKAVGIEEADRIRNRATARGSNYHLLVEQYLNNEPVKAFDPVLQVMINKSKKVLNNIDNIQGIEYPLYSDILKLAGTVDCFGSYCGIPSVIDFKTSKQGRSADEIEAYFIQTSIYSYMIEERYSIKLNNLVILLQPIGEEVQVFIEKRSNWKKKIKNLLK
jgi:genome maintenance exonuclease 1